MLLPVDVFNYFPELPLSGFSLIIEYVLPYCQDNFRIILSPFLLISFTDTRLQPFRGVCKNCAHFQHVSHGTFSCRL